MISRNYCVHSKQLKLFGEPEYVDSDATGKSLQLNIPQILRKPPQTHKLVDHFLGGAEHFTGRCLKLKHMMEAVMPPCKVYIG